MKTSTRKPCPTCCNAANPTCLHDRGFSADDSPVWVCRCCANELPRRVRAAKPRTASEVALDAELEEMLLKYSPTI